MTSTMRPTTTSRIPTWIAGGRTHPCAARRARVTAPDASTDAAGGGRPARRHPRRAGGRARSRRELAEDAESADGTVVPLRRRWCRACRGRGGRGHRARRRGGRRGQPRPVQREPGERRLGREHERRRPSRPRSQPRTPESGGGLGDRCRAGAQRCRPSTPRWRGWCARATCVAPRLRAGRGGRLQDSATADAQRNCGLPRTGSDRRRAAHPRALRRSAGSHCSCRPARGGEQLVEAWTCTGDRVLDRARVPRREASATGQSSAGSTGLASPSRHAVDWGHVHPRIGPGAGAGRTARTLGPRARRTRSVSCEVELDVREEAELVWSVAVAHGPDARSEELSITVDGRPSRSRSCRVDDGGRLHVCTAPPGRLAALLRAPR